jgi:hypothetical protein
MDDKPRDRRAQFFVLAALLCVVLVPLAPHDFKEVTAVVAVTYLVLALASYLDFRSRH